uniref:RAB, member RAS oncogene family-like 6a n=1 Tax=Sinocyclocheilus rhinocerous TaxID=307959 RepID=A0A673JWQ6_9TELE
WHRLQGKKFLEEYIPTQEIQLRIELWNKIGISQKTFANKRGENLKLENEPQESETEMALDAEFLDVYKNCNGVIMMFDITKQWTFNYILRELPKVPTHIPVCVLGNQRDMGEHRVILPDDIRDFINSLNRPPGSSYIHYAESSMKNGFGLKYLHRFFNIPFLQLQVRGNSQTYGSPAPSNGQSPSSGSQSPVVLPGAASPSNSSPSTPQAPVPLQTQSAPPPPPSIPHPPPSPTAPVPAPAQPAPPPAQKRGFISRLFGSSAAETSPDKPGQHRTSLPVICHLSDGEGRGNPLVSGFQDDLDPDDRALSQPAVKAAVPSIGVTLTSDDEEEDSSLPSAAQHKGIGSGPNSKG